MSKLIADLSISLDGFVAGPDPSMQDPLGIGGMQLHEWAFAAMSWQSAHGHEGGEKNADSDLIDSLHANVGAGIMGRKMYSGGSGPWADDANGRGWWGENPPFHHEVFVLTSHAREPLVMEGDTTFHFITDGVQAAYNQATAASGGKDIQIHGGGSAVSQYLRAGLLDELTVHVAPVFLGSGTRLLQDVPPGKLEQRSVVESPAGVTHITYRVLR